VYLKTVGQIFLLSTFLTFRSMSPAGCCPHRSVPLRQTDHSFTSIIRREVAVNAQLNDVNAIEPELNLNPNLDPNPRPPAPNKSGKCSTAASLLLWHMARIPPTLTPIDQFHFTSLHLLVTSHPQAQNITYNNANTCSHYNKSGSLAKWLTQDLAKLSNLQV
jgi:hypothetical protein